MITDQRLDQLIRSSLQWEASRAAAAQPSLRQQSRRLALRLGPSSSVIRPRVVATRSTRSAANLITVLLLLLLALVATAVVGSALLREFAPAPVPVPFGFASDCGAGPRDTAVLRVDVDGRSTTLYETGALVVDRSVASESRTGTLLGTAYDQRLLSTRGAGLLLDRVEDLRLTPGCRSLRTDTASGSITARTAAGVIELAWAPGAGASRLARLATTEEESTLSDLADALEEPSAWLPDNGWVDSAVRSMTPERWLVLVGMLPTDYVPGDRLNLPNGVFIDGFDPRYAQVVLPDGQQLATFGSDLDLSGRLGPDSSERCALIETEDARALADSLDSMTLGADGFGDLFSEDLSTAISVELVPAFPAGRDCLALAQELASALEGQPTPTASTDPLDLAGIDPCTLLPMAAAESILGADESIVEPSQVRFGVPAAQACGLFEAPDETGPPEGNIRSFAGRRVTVSLYPRSVEEEDGRATVMSVFGDGTVEERVAGRPVWENECLLSDSDCHRAMAAWSGPYLLVFEFDLYRGMPNASRVPSEKARRFVEATLAGLED